MVLAYLAVCTCRLRITGYVKAEVQRLNDQRHEINVSRDYAAAFAGAEALGGVKAERNRNVANVPLWRLR